MGTVRAITGAAITVQSAFVDANGAPADPTSSPGFTFSLYDPSSATTTGTYNPNAGPYTFTRVSAGVFSVTIVPTLSGLYRWQFLGSVVAGVPQSWDGAFTARGAFDWPFEYGYCQLSDVQARINSGQWNPTATGAYPTVDQANEFITQSSAQIESVLARRGYTIPLVAQPGKVIQPQAWAILTEICAELAAGKVEATRRQSQDKAGEAIPAWHLKYADDLLARLENGDDNLTVFGVSGPFEPDAQPSRAATMVVPTGYFNRANLDSLFGAPDEAESADVSDDDDD